MSVTEGRLLFFSGGTALRGTSRVLARHTAGSIHIVTPFDSGGSSAEIRRSFAMPAVGDMRNRLLALAERLPDTSSALDFCSARLPAEGDAGELRRYLRKIGGPRHPLWSNMPDSAAGYLRGLFNSFLTRMPPAFNPLNASLGNIVLAAGYLDNNRDFGPVLGQLGRILHVRGEVFPVVRENLHLGAILSDGSVLLGQHLFKNLPSPISRIFLSVYERDGHADANGPAECRPRLSEEAENAIGRADSIIYPMGSFYSSLLANLLPRGVGTAVRRARCPKIFVPNSGGDAESAGLCLDAQATLLLDTLAADAPTAGANDLLNYVLVDSRHGRYTGGCGREIRDSLSGIGVRLVDVEDMVVEDNPRSHAPEILVRALLRLTQDSPA